MRVHRLTVVQCVCEIDVYSDCSDCSSATFFQLYSLSDTTVLVLDRKEEFGTGNHLFKK